MTVTRKPLISGNWKMNFNHFEAIQFVQKLAFTLRREDYDSVDVTLHPPFTDLRSIQTLLDADRIPMSLGSQHCHWDDKGAMTGEVSPAFLSKLNVAYVIVGHSERREMFNQTDEVVERTLRAILAHDMTPILCVGETLAERDAGQTEGKVSDQVRAALAGIAAEKVAGMVIAYEPIWAIGTGRTSSSSDAQAVCASIRGVVERQSGAEAAAAVRIQYGGSVKAVNIAELMAQPDIDGALVGGASLDVDEFARIVNFRKAA